MDQIRSEVNVALNTLSPDSADDELERVSDDIVTIAAQSESETDGHALRIATQIIVQRACSDPVSSTVYAKLCERISKTISPEIKDENIRDKNRNPISGGNLFKKYLVNRCQEEFETSHATSPAFFQFIGELYKAHMAHLRVIHACATAVLNSEGLPEDAGLVSLATLLRTAGPTMSADEVGAQMIRAYFERIERIRDLEGLSGDMHAILSDLLDFRAKWEPTAQVGTTQ